MAGDTVAAVLGPAVECWSRLPGCEGRGSLCGNEVVFGEGEKGG